MSPLLCVLKKGKEKPLLGHHPWIFSGAIDRIEEGYRPGDLVRVCASDGRLLGVGYLNPHSQITVRMLAFADEEISGVFFQRRIQAAAALRKKLFPDPGRTNAYRLIHAEADFLPGLIADKYGDLIVVQFLTAGMEAWKAAVVAGLLDLPVGVKGIYEKSDSEVRQIEGLAPSLGILAGEAPEAFVEILENGLCFAVDFREGQKTGFFLDQRDNRELVSRYAAGMRVLNGFCYTGAFSVYAGSSGALSVTSVDSSQSALDLAAVNLKRNGLMGSYDLIRENVFRYLRGPREDFDFIILDPPAFCQTKQQIDQAARGYKDINLLAIRKLPPGGLLFTSSCSSYISPDLFQKILFAAAKDAGRDLRILTKTGQPADHPVNIYHPEGEYLKSCLCEVV